MKFLSRHVVWTRFYAWFHRQSPRGIVLFLFEGKKKGQRRGKKRSSNVGLTQVDGGWSEGSVDAYANGRVPISNDFIMVLPRVIGDFVSTIGGTMDVCRSVTTGINRVCQKGKSFARRKRHENNIHFFVGNRSVPDNIGIDISNDNFTRVFLIIFNN